MKPSGEYFEVVVFDSRGVPYDWDAQQQVTVLDLEYFPAFQHRPMIISSGYGCVRLPCAEEPFAVGMPLRVDGFGHVWVYADNEGRGYRSKEIAGKRLTLNVEFARSRLAAVRRAVETWAREGLVPGGDCRRDLDAASGRLEDATREAADVVAQSRHAMASLALSLRAGETLVLEHARARIAARPARPDFLWGCNGFAYPTLGERYAGLFRGVFNYITAPFYRRGTERVEGTRDFGAAQKIVEWGRRDGLAVKGHPLVWLHEAGTPDWLRDRSWEQVLATHVDYITDAVTRFRGGIDRWDVINEAHSWNNIHRWPYTRLIDMTRAASETTRAANPAATRVVNLCFTWSEYVSTGWGWNNTLDEPGRSTLEYTRDLIAAKVPFEAIGLQMYDPGRDLFEISRHIDLFCRLGKRVHITELGISSANNPLVREEKVYVPNRMYWHGRPWSQREQADWVEAYYTLCYSKPEIDAVTWWDFADPSFLPHGGLVDEGLRPKQAYRTLERLRAGWSRR